MGKIHNSLFNLFRNKTVPSGFDYYLSNSVLPLPRLSWCHCKKEKPGFFYPLPACVWLRVFNAEEEKGIFTPDECVQSVPKEWKHSAVLQIVTQKVFKVPFS